MVTIFHLSDLHIVTSARWNNLRGCILNEARTLGAAKERGEKLLVVTGDFHNFSEGNYDKTEKFLGDLIAALDIDPAEDVFVIPGNHDVGSAAAMKPFFKDDGWEYRQNSTTEWLKSHDTAEKFYKRNVEGRLESYTPYCDFVRRLGVYPDDAGLTPAGVHVRCWPKEKPRLNLLHLNTTLIADGSSKTGQRLDILSATSPAIWDGQDESLPTLALGHNNFFDLDEQQREMLVPPLINHKVCAYLCGDTHKAEVESNCQNIRLDYGRSDKENVIPNVVGVKGAADESDKFSDFGLYLHEWDEAAGTVTLRLLRWLPEQTQAAFKREEDGGYSMPHQTTDEMRRELEQLREELKKKDGPRPPETPCEERARALALAGRNDEALTILRKTTQKKSGFFAKLVNKLTEWGIISPQPLTIVQIASNAGDEEDAEQARKRGIRQHINKVLLRIDILKSKGINRETIPEIRACYEECVNLAKAHRVSVYVLYDYASFLWRQHEYTPAIEAARWLLDYCKRENEPEEQLAMLENLLGNLLSDTNRPKEAEEQFRAALEIYRRLAAANPAAYEPNLAMTCNNLGVLLKDTNRPKEAEEQFRAALGLCRKLAAANPAAYEPDLAMTCNNLGNLLRNTNRPKEAEEQFRAALGLYRKLAEANPAAYEPNVATTCNNLGNLLSDTNRTKEAEDHYREALAIRRKLAAANPAANEPHLATTCFNYGLLLRKDAARKAEAKPLFEEAARLWDKYPHHSELAQRAHDILDEEFN